MIDKVVCTRNGKDELTKIEIIGDDLKELSGRVTNILGFYREGAIISIIVSRCDNGEKWKAVIDFM